MVIHSLQVWKLESLLKSAIIFGSRFLFSKLLICKFIEALGRIPGSGYMMREHRKPYTSQMLTFDPSYTYSLNPALQINKKSKIEVKDNS
ncbi:hypothetical protein Hanom_Chr11g01058291 [Helianthus anomalus]